MRGRLVDRRWLWPLVGIIVFVLACLALGWWQWDRAQSASGTARNLAYALEWPSFAGFAIYMLVKAIKLERVKDEPAAEEIDGADRAGSTGQKSAEAVEDRRSPTPAVAAPAPPGTTAWTARRPSIPADDPDDELVSYNRYLASLNAAEQRDSR